ncbi:MAG: ImmA/IrrE family metallo-endopeptidase [Streptosporangiaceae bacterium]
MSGNEQAARARAETFRAEHDLGNRPLGDLFELVHATCGCDALAIDAQEAEHGLSMLDPVTGRVVIVVATTRHPMRQRSSLAHEIGHVAAGDLQARPAGPPGSRGPAEIQADAFARHLLLPVRALHDRFGRPSRDAAAPDVGEPELAAVVQEFEVSPSLAAIQLKEAGLIRQQACDEWQTVSTSTIAARYGWLSQYRAMSVAAAQPRAPQTLMRRAVEGYHRGVVGLQELARWYGLDPEQLLGEIGPPRDVPPDESTAPCGGDLDEDVPLFPAGSGGAPGS